MNKQPPSREDSLATLQGRISYRFSDISLLDQALTHVSYSQEHAGHAGNNQRLEFLGDAVLQLLISEALYTLFPADREGVLTKRRSVLARGSFLATLAMELGLPDCLQMAANEEACGGQLRPSALEDAFEALFGAIYVDGGLSACREAARTVYGDIGARLAQTEDQANPKGRLQELVQPLLGNEALKYEVMTISGEEHARRYQCGCYLQGRLLGTGEGSSKKTAEEAAARTALLVVRSEGLTLPGKA